MLGDFEVPAVHFPGCIFGGDRLCKRERVASNNQSMSPNKKHVSIKLLFRKYLILGCEIEVEMHLQYSIAGL